MQCDNCFWQKDSRCQCPEWKGTTVQQEMDMVQKDIINCPYHIEGVYNRTVTVDGKTYGIDYAKRNGSTKRTLALWVEDIGHYMTFNTTAALRKYLRR